MLLPAKKSGVGAFFVHGVGVGVVDPARWLAMQRWQLQFEAAEQMQKMIGGHWHNGQL